MKSCKREIPFGAAVRGEGGVCSTTFPHLMLDESFIHMFRYTWHLLICTQIGCQLLVLDVRV